MAYTPGQARCIETLDTALVVSAGAGSGKTFTLTRRIVNALSTGFVDDVDQLLAITFTTKAAGEIKSRVKSALRAEGRIDQALKVDNAWISTIHGMCSRILRENALAVGISPTFSVIDEAGASDLLDDAMEEVLGAADELVTPGGLDALFEEYHARSRSSFDSGSIESMVRLLVSKAAAHPDGMSGIVASPSSPYSPEKNLSRLMECAEAVAVAARSQKKGSSQEAFVEGTERALEKASAAMDAGGIDARSLMDLMDEFPLPGKRFGSADFKEYAAEAAETYKECMLEARLRSAEPLLGGLMALADKVLAAYTQRKRSRDVLDNNDLLVLAARAFEDHPDIAHRYADAFRLVMVDEFQDTDQLQVDMIKRMSGPGSCRLCTVGDVQQSIYRFRGADVSVYRRHLSAVESADPEGVIVLPDNFRSHRDILSFCDRVFEQPSAFGDSFMSLAPARDESKVKQPFKGSGPRIEVQLTTYPFRGVGRATAVEEAARRIASSFAALRDAGHSAGDMVVLLGSMSRSSVYADALREQGFACVIAGGSVFNRAPEVRLMVELAKVIANPRDTEALFGILSSELFALSADDLLDLSTRFDETYGIGRRRSLDEGFRALAAGLDGGLQVSPAMESAVRIMKKASVLVRRGCLSDAMDMVVLDSGLLSRLEGEGAEGQAHAANVLKAIRMVREIERDSCAGPSSVARMFAARIDVAKEAPGALSAAGGDFVRIMTVHASKGLEFPIVAVAEMRDAPARSSKLLAADCAGRAYLSLDAGSSLEDVPSSSLIAKCSSFSPFEEYDDDQLHNALVGAEDAAHLRSAIREYERRGDTQEAYRLLYVALTRAKEALVVSMCGQRSSKDPSGLGTGALSSIQSALCGEGGLFQAGVSRCEYGGTQPALVERVDLEALPEGGYGPVPCDGESESDGRLPGEPGSGEPEGEGGFALFSVPVVEDCHSRADRAFRPSRADVFSYSSISEGAAHGIDEDDPLLGFAFDGGIPAGEAGFGFRGASDALSGDVPLRGADRACTDADSPEWEELALDLADHDRATDLGTAFHRLAQYAVLIFGADRSKGLVLPPSERIDALSRSCRLDAGRRARLREALVRWFESDVAHHVERCSSVRAEVPFFVPLDNDGKRIFLEGEIDMLAVEPDSEIRRAFVVDYKTGGTDDESDRMLYEKHLLQAMCYAYAVLGSGFDVVEACFVRVEHCSFNDEMRFNLIDAGEGGYDGAAPSYGQPQCVRYVFRRSQRDMLADEIVAAYRRAR